jgi:ABC-type nitrate/sulfonate/bicarbonate transport system substrate-binding protein
MPVELRYGQVQRSAMNWPFFSATELDLFAAGGLVVKSTIFASPPDPVNALLSGSLDVINVIPDVALAEMARGAPLRVVANTNVGSQYRLVVDAAITTFTALRGKKIGVNDGRSAEALILKRLLARNNLPDGSYELVPAGPPQQRCEKVKQGLLAGSMLTEPFHFMLQEEGFRLLGSSLDVVPHYPFTVCLVRRSATPDESYLAFLKTLRAAWFWLNDPANRDEAASILTRCTGCAERHALATYDLYFTPPAPPNFTPDPLGITSVLELLAESGRISPPLPIAGTFIDDRYVRLLNER